MGCDLPRSEVIFFVFQNREVLTSLNNQENSKINLMEAICKYKEGDKVRIKSEQWYNDNKNDDDRVVNERTLESFTAAHSRHCGEIMTIKEVVQVDPETAYYEMVEDNRDLIWEDEMIECKVGQIDRMVSLEKVCKYLENHPSVDIEGLKRYLGNN